MLRFFPHRQVVCGAAKSIADGKSYSDRAKNGVRRSECENGMNNTVTKTDFGPRAAHPLTRNC
jgi:hypothetical protein